MSARGRFVPGLDKRRVEGLTDGIFGTVMTILGLTLAVPYIAALGQKPQDIVYSSLITGILVYALSFIILGVYWVGHHVAFEFIRSTDRPFIWMNNMFLLFIGLIPLTTALLGDAPLEQGRLIIYGLNLEAIGLSLSLQTRHATHDDHLVDRSLSPQFLRLGQRRILMGPAFATTAILLSFVSTVASLATFVLMPIPFIFPGRIDAAIQRLERR